jgi:hypothetical protein
VCELTGAPVDNGTWYSIPVTSVYSSGFFEGTKTVSVTFGINTVGVDLSTTSVTDIWTSVLTEDYAALGAEGSAAQILYAIQQFLLDGDQSGTTITVRQLDGSTAAYTITLDDATTPTDKNRAS